MAFRPSDRRRRAPRRSPATSRTRLLRSRPAGGQRLQERRPGVPARVLLGAAALAGGGRHLARLGAAGRGAPARHARLGRPAGPHARPDRDLDRPLHRPGAARRGDLPDRSELGRAQRPLQRLHRRAPLHAARHRVRRPAAHRLRPDLPRSLRSSRRADRAPPRPEVRSRSSSCRSASRPGSPIAASPTRWSSTGASRSRSRD